MFQQHLLYKSDNGLPQYILAGLVNYENKRCNKWLNNDAYFNRNECVVSSA